MAKNFFQLPCFIKKYIMFFNLCESVDIHFYKVRRYYQTFQNYWSTCTVIYAFNNSIKRYTNFVRLSITHNTIGLSS